MGNTMPDLRKYHKLEKELRMKIASGFLPDYHKLYPENVLAHRYGISRGSVRRALANLERDGLIFRKRGSGTFVTPESERLGKQENQSKGKTIVYLSFSSLYSQKTFSHIVTSRARYDGLSKILIPAGYNFRSAHVGRNWKLPIDLASPEIGGVIFEGVVPEEFFNKYLAGKPCIGVNCYDPHLDCSWVLEDSRSVAELSVEHLYSLGYRKIAILSDEASAPPVRESLLGYCTGLRQLGLPFREDFVIFWERERINGELCNEPFGLCSFKPRLEKLFTSGDHPDAIICQDKYRADQTRAALEEMGFNVPGDVGLICRTDRVNRNSTKMVYEAFCARKLEVFLQAAKEIIEEIEHRTVTANRVTYMRPLLLRGDSVIQK